MLGVGNIKKDAKYAIAIIAAPLGNRAICTVVNVCVAKALLVDDAINVRRAISDIRRAIDAIVIATARSRLGTIVWQLHVTIMDNVRAKHLCGAKNAISVSRRHSVCRNQMQMDVRDAFVSADRLSANRVVCHGDKYGWLVPAVSVSSIKIMNSLFLMNSSRIDCCVHKKLISNDSVDWLYCLELLVSHLDTLRCL